MNKPIAAMLILATLSIHTLAFCGDTERRQSNDVYAFQSILVQLSATNYERVNISTTEEQTETNKQKVVNIILGTIVAVAMIGVGVAFAANR
jgi:hypothetical protein